MVARAGKRYGLLVATGLLLSAGCAAATDPTPGPTATVADRLTAGIADYGRFRPLQDIRAVVVLVDGETVLEHYDGTTPEEYRNVASVTKSVVSTLVGIAVEEGDIPGVQATLEDLLPDDAPGMRPEVAGTTLEHLLTMTAGFRSERYGADEPYGEDWVTDILTRPVDPPGKFFAYSDDAAHLVAAVLVEATGQPLLEYARTMLLDPLGIQTRPSLEPLAAPENLQAYLDAAFAWPVDPQGVHLGAAFLKLRPLDMARLGQLFLDRGQWDGEQLVPADWVQTATSAHVTAGSGTSASDYGYMWWVDEVDGEQAFMAIGIGGQLVEVVPSLGLVVAVSTEVDWASEEPPPVDGLYTTELVRTVIAPVIQEARQGGEG